MPRRRVNMRGLAAELAELERTNPEVRKAAENLERVKAQIIGGEINRHWFTHELVDGRWEHLYDAYWNHPASGARAPKRGVSMDTMLCDCATSPARPYGPVPEPGRSAP